MTDRPNHCTDEHLNVLDQLAAGGLTNLLGLRGELMRRFPDLTRAEVEAILFYWRDRAAP